MADSTTCTWSEHKKSEPREFGRKKISVCMIFYEKDQVHLLVTAALRVSRWRPYLQFQEWLYPECPSDRNSSEGFVGHPPSSTGWGAILPQARRTPDTQQMTIRMGRHPGMFCFDTWWTVFPFIIGIHSHITGNFYVSATSNDLSLLGPNDDLQSQLEETAYILRSQDTVWDISQPLNKRWTPKTVKTASQQDVGLSTIVYIYN